MQMSSLDNALYFCKDQKGEITGAMASHVDDLIYVGDPECTNKIIGKIIKIFKISKHEIEDFVFTGWSLKQDNTGITLSQKDYLDNLDLEEYETLANFQGSNEKPAPDHIQDLFRSINGVLGWISQVSHPNLAYHFVHYSTKLGKATPKDAKGIFKLIVINKVVSIQ